jgi:hypothetical protein
MSHFYGTEEELKIWLAQKTERALADVALGKVHTVQQVRDDLIKARNKNYAHV